MKCRVAVVGAGIGGLAAAIAARDAGCPVAVYEQADEIRPLGAGLSIWPNGVRALRALGLGDLVEAAPPGDGALRRADGSPLARFDPAELERRYGAPLAGLHRADLHEALIARLGAERVRLASRVEGVDGGGLTLASGETVEAELVVGADGLRSRVREVLLGDGEPRAAGIVAFRGVSEPEGAVPAGEWWGNGGVAGLLPLAGARTYWYVAFRGEAGDRAGLERVVEQFSAPLPEIVAATPAAAVLSHELFDRAPARSWSRANATLLGDAAHPMLPFLGQGACSALEDAVALGRALAAGTDLDAVLAAYEAERHPPTARLVKGSRAAARVALARPGLARAVRNQLVGRVPESMRLRQLDGMLGRVE